MKKIKKPVQIGVGLSLLGDAGDAAREATREAMRQAGLERADWAFCFFSTPHLGRADAVRDRVLEGSGCLALSGCSAMGVIGGGREVEGGAAVGVMVGCSPRIEARSALLPETWDGLERFLGGGAQQNRKTTLFALPDSYRVDNTRMQQRLAIKLDGEGLLGANLFGAGATDDGSVGLSLQLGMEGVRSASIAMMRFDGDYEISVGITQSCTAVGDPHFITRADDFIMKELDGRPALKAFLEQGQALGMEDMQQVAQELLFGFPLDRENPNFTGDSCIVRALAGFDQESQGLVVPHPMDTSMTMGFMHRNPANAELDLRRMVGGLAERMDGPPDFGLYFDCAARGRNFYGREGVDLSVIHEQLGTFPLLGMFGGYELATAHGSTQVYTYTGVLVLIRIP